MGKGRPAWTSTGPGSLGIWYRRGKQKRSPTKRRQANANILQKKHRYQLFRSKLAKLFSTKLQDSDSIKLTELVPLVNEGLGTEELFGSAEAVEVLRAMGESEEVMLDDEGMVWKI